MNRRGVTEVLLGMYLAALVLLVVFMVMWVHVSTDRDYWRARFGDLGSDIRMSCKLDVDGSARCMPPIITTTTTTEVLR